MAVSRAMGIPLSKRTSNEGSVRDGASRDDWVRRKSSWPGRSWLGDARFQNNASPSRILFEDIPHRGFRNAIIPLRKNPKPQRPLSLKPWRTTKPCEHKVPWLGALKTVERLPSRELRRDLDALHETAEATDYVSKLQVRIAALNGYIALGIPVTETMGQVCPENRSLSHQSISATQSRRKYGSKAWPKLFCNADLLVRRRHRDRAMPPN